MLILSILVYTCFGILKWPEVEGPYEANDLRGPSWRPLQRAATSMLQREIDERNLQPLVSKKHSILIAIGVFNVQRDIDLFMQNHKYLQRSLGNDTVHFGIYHADGKTSEWDKQKFYAKRHNGIVVHRKAEAGCKAHQIQLHDPEIVKQYDFLWIMDSDLDLEFFDWQLYKRTFLLFQPMISQPVLLGVNRTTRTSDLMTPKMKDHDVIVTKTQYVENNNMILNASYWPMLHSYIKEVDDRADFGIGRWINMVQLYLSFYCNKSLAIAINLSPSVHHDWRTLDVNKSCYRGCIKKDCKVASRPEAVETAWNAFKKLDPLCAQNSDEEEFREWLKSPKSIINEYYSRRIHVDASDLRKALAPRADLDDIDAFMAKKLVRLKKIGAITVS